MQCIECCRTVCNRVILRNTKGDKCKFSHDLSIERKAEKRSLYCDMRDDDKETDTMDKWDEDKLKEVVEKKHGSGNRPTTDIVSVS